MRTVTAVPVEPSFPLVTGAMAIGRLAISAIGMISGLSGNQFEIDIESVRRTGGGIRDSRTIPSRVPDIANNTFPAPTELDLNGLPWLIGPWRPSAPVGANPNQLADDDDEHGDDEPNRVEPVPNVAPLQPLDGPSAPHNSTESSDDSINAGDDRDPWRPLDEGDRSVENGDRSRSENREQEERDGRENSGDGGDGDGDRDEGDDDGPDPDDGMGRYKPALRLLGFIKGPDDDDDELFQKWKAWIRLFRAWRHDVWATSKELTATKEVQALLTNHPFMLKAFLETISEIVSKPKTPYPVVELSIDLADRWYPSLASVYFAMRDAEWAKDVKSLSSLDQEIRMVSVLNRRLRDIADLITEKQKTRWVSHDFPGDPVDVTTMVQPAVQPKTS